MIVRIMLHSYSQNRKDELCSHCMKVAVCKCIHAFSSYLIPKIKELFLIKKDMHGMKGFLNGLILTIVFCFLLNQKKYTNDNYADHNFCQSKLWIKCNLQQSKLLLSFCAWCCVFGVLGYTAVLVAIVCKSHC